MKFHKRDGVKYGIEDEIFVLCHFKNGRKVYIFYFLLVKKRHSFPNRKVLSSSLQMFITSFYLKENTKYFK